MNNLGACLLTDHLRGALDGPDMDLESKGETSALRTKGRGARKSEGRFGRTPPTRGHLPICSKLHAKPPGMGTWPKHRVGAETARAAGRVPGCARHQALRKSWIVVRRQACHPRLANAVYHWARVAIQHDPRSRAKYAELRRRGHSHGRALRSVADRLLNVACAMLKSGTLFNATLAAQKTA